MTEYDPRRTVSGGLPANRPTDPDELDDMSDWADASPPQQPRRFCADCGHWEHDPGACDGLGHEWDGLSGLPVASDCGCEVHDDQRAVEPPLPVDPRPTPGEQKAYEQGMADGRLVEQAAASVAASVTLPVDPIDEPDGGWAAQLDPGRCQCGHYHGQTEDQDDAGCNGGCTDDHQWSASVPLPVDGLRLLLADCEDALRQPLGKSHLALANKIAAVLSGTEPGKPTALSRTDPPRCDECGRVGYIVGVGADLRIGGHLDRRVKHPFLSGTEPGE